MKKPAECETADEARAEIDRLDQALVDLLAERWGYVDRMWQFKRLEASAASVPWRNADVIEKVRTRAEKAGMPPEMAEALWRQIIGWGVQHQEEKLREE
ncbi:MAG: chorismate mutase [Pseudomonadota bacterium]